MSFTTKNSTAFSLAWSSLDKEKETTKETSILNFLSLNISTNCFNLKGKPS